VKITTDSSDNYLHTVTLSAVIYLSKARERDRERSAERQGEVSRDTERGQQRHRERSAETQREVSRDTERGQQIDREVSRERRRRRGGKLTHLQYLTQRREFSSLSFRNVASFESALNPYFVFFPPRTSSDFSDTETAPGTEDAP
jgi:hypothetical protein